MRIILLLSSLYTGGAEFSSLVFYGWLRRQGFDVKLVCYKKASPSYDPEKFGLTDVVTLEEEGFFKKLKLFKSIVAEYKPVLIHSVLFEANILGRFCKFSNSSFIHLESLVNEMYAAHRLHDPNVKKYKLKAYQLFDFTSQIFGVDHFHANGISVAKHYQNKLKISSKRITIIPRGRATNSFIGNTQLRQEIRSELGIAENAFIVVHVARHEYQKAQDVLLEALVKIKDKENLVLLLVGREGNLTSVINNAIEASNLYQYVKCIGHRNDIPRLLAASDVFVFPSRFEGLPGALIEAEAAGLPIVCSDIPNNREVATEGENALFFRVNDSSDLAQKLSLMIHDKLMCVEMGARSLDIFQQNFELDEIHAKMKTLILRLVNRP